MRDVHVWTGHPPFGQLSKKEYHAMAQTGDPTPAPPGQPEFSRRVPVGRIGTLALDMTVEARAEECRAIAARLGVPSVGALRCVYRVAAAHRRGHFTAHGLLDARVRRVCVVTLEHFTETVAESFEIRFVPEHQIGEDISAEDPDSVDEVPYDGEALDLGEEAVAQLALMLAPYPRKDGARHDVGVDVVPAGEDAETEEETSETRPSPFAALAKLRDKMQ